MDEKHINGYLKRFVRAENRPEVAGEKLKEREDGLSAREVYERIIGDEGFKKTHKSKKCKADWPQEKFGINNDSKEEIVAGNAQLQNDESDSITGLRLQQSSEREFKSKCNLFRMISNGNLKDVKRILLLKKEWINVTDDYGWTPMMCAVASGNFEMVEFLFEMNADVYNIRDNCGQNAWDIALKLKKSDIVEMLFHKRIKKEPEENIIYNEDNHNINNEQKYCEICRTQVDCDQLKSHDTSMSHLFNLYKGQDTKADYHLAANNIGYKMLKEAGWSEEKGLGPDGRGQKQPVSTILKSDRSGLGMKEKEKKKVTHFKANDVNAIKHRRESQFTKKRILKREKIKSKMKSKQWEIDLRSYMAQD